MHVYERSFTWESVYGVLLLRYKKVHKGYLCTVKTPELQFTNLRQMQEINIKSKKRHAKGKKDVDFVAPHQTEFGAKKKSRRDVSVP